MKRSAKRLIGWIMAVLLLFGILATMVTLMGFIKTLATIGAVGYLMLMTHLLTE